MRTWGARVFILAVLLGCLALTTTASAAKPTRRPGADRHLRPGISTRALPDRLLRGARTHVTGTLILRSGGAVGDLLELQFATGAHSRFRNVAHTLTGAGGRYRFPALRIFANTRLRVIDVRRAVRAGPTIAVRIVPPLYPVSRRVVAAARYLSARAGSAAFAVIDDRGRLAGVNLHRRYHSASVVKSMLLVAYLRMLQTQRRPLDSQSQALLYPMIHSSDNGAASAVLGIVGQGALDAVAHEAEMRDYQPSGAGWGFTEVSAADLARFFFIQDKLIPPRFDGYARWLLSGIEASESWGIPAVARPEFRVFFKGGWLPEVEGLVNQVGRLERPGISFAMSVLTTHDPSMLYGEQTIEGVTARLLGRAS